MYSDPRHTFHSVETSAENIVCIVKNAVKDNFAVLAYLIGQLPLI